MDKGEHILLLVDANETVDEKGSLVDIWTRKLNLIDMGRKDPKNMGGETNTRGRRIDLCFASEGLIGKIDKMSVENYEEGIMSDHKGLVIEIAWTTQNRKERLKREERILNSKSPLKCQKYIECLVEELCLHKVEDKLKQLNQEWKESKQDIEIYIDRYELLAERVRRSQIKLNEDVAERRWDIHGVPN